METTICYVGFGLRVNIRATRDIGGNEKENGNGYNQEPSGEEKRKMTWKAGLCRQL